MNIAPSDWSRLLPLIDQALDIPSGEREIWLAGLALGEPLESALRSLLLERRAIESGDFLGALPIMAQRSASGERLVAGGLIGPWRLLREIGRGGMSTVWLAERADAQVQREVALKLPHAGPGQELLAARLLRERNILAALEHRNIGRLYDVGVTEAGTPYLVMEHVQGTDLLDYADSCRLSVSGRLALFQQILRAVQYAHSKLILHRDIKPGNILVNEAGDVKLLDFGIAKLLAVGSQGADPTELTRAAGRHLTLAYASPEQVRGEPLAIASDVYSLGVVLFELLTGERPYTVARDSRGAWEDAVLDAEPRRPSQAWTASRSAAPFGSTARAMQRRLAGDLDVITLTALQKVPGRRYPTVDAMALDLRRHLAGEPILAHASSRSVQLRKFVARHAVGVGAAVAVLAALSIGLGAALWQGHLARQEATRATAIKNFLVTLLRGNDLDKAEGQPSGQLTLQSVLKQSAAELATGLKGQPEIQDELRSLVAGLMDNLDLLEASIPLRQQHARDLAARHAPIAAQVRALSDLAESQHGRLDEARATLEQAWSMCLAGPAHIPSPECLSARLELGRNLLAIGDTERGRVHVETAASALMAVPQVSLDRAIAARSLAELRTLQGRPNEADALAQRALDDFEALWGPRSARLAMEWRLYANQMALQQRFAEAIKLYAKAWEIRAQATGPDAIASAKLEMEMGLLQTRVGQDPQGEQHLLHASRVMLDSQGPERGLLVIKALRARAELYVYSGRLGLAGPVLDQLDAAMQQYPLNASEAHDRDVLRALFLTRTGQFQAAQQLLERRRETTLRQQGPEAQDLPSLDDRITDTLVAAGRMDAAEALARDRGRGSSVDALLARGRYHAAWPGVQARYAHTQSRPRSDQYQLNVVKAAEAMGMALAGQGLHRQAVPYLEQAIADLASGYPHNPALAALRARLASTLLALRDTDAARAQLALAESAVRAEPLAGPQFRGPVRVAREQLSRAVKKV